MRQGLKLLVLAGSAEARSIAVAAAGQGAQVRAVVSEPPRGPDPMPVPCALISLADPGAMQNAMAGVDAVLDASHGFDAAMSHAGFDAAQRLGVPYLAFVRPPWGIESRAGCQPAPDVASAMPLISPGARVFSATGWASLPDCAAFPGAVLMLRQTMRHDRPPPYAFVELVFGAPPFSRDSEIALFRTLRVDTLICRNLGGRASRPKVDAAQGLGLRLILIDRPPVPEGADTVDTVEAALAWLALR